jgi:hypothetical protein
VAERIFLYSVARHFFIYFYSTQVALKNDVIKSNERGRKIRSAFNDAVRVMRARAKDASFCDAGDAIAVNENPGPRAQEELRRRTL